MITENQEVHTCVYCGQEAHFQFKNGKWCCVSDMRKCPGFKEKISHGMTRWHRNPIRQKEKYPSKGEHVCVYCGKYANYQLRSGKWCCMPSSNQCPYMKEQNSKGLKKAHEQGSYDKWNATRRINGSWNKGHTAKNDSRIAKGIKVLKEGYASGRLKGSWCGKKHTEEQKKTISESMKKAHREGRAYVLGTYERLGNPSRPEQWMIDVIANEFEDKNYQREYRIFNYSLDFAWPHKKKYIEMDGEQHFRFENRLYDLERDKKICAEGWEVLRMPWDKVCQNPKLWIQKAKDFIHSTNLSTI